MEMNRIIIAISGDKNVGKDTTATMLEYIKNVGIAGANYAQWYTKYVAKEENAECIIHFADKLKELCASITNLPLRYFNSHSYKDEFWWIYGTDKFISEIDMNKEEDSPSKDKYYQIHNLNMFTLAEQIKRAKDIDEIPVIRLRTILQFVGTEMFRNMYDPDYFINDTIKKMRSICNFRDICIIPDLRFQSEVIALRKACNCSKYRLLVINIGEEETFTKNVTERGLHASEKKLADFDIYLSNKKTGLMILFNKVLELYQKQILK